KATTSCPSSRANGRRPSGSSMPGGTHDALEIHAACQAHGAGAERPKRRLPPDHLRDDRVAGRPRAADHAGALRPCDRGTRRAAIAAESLNVTIACALRGLTTGYGPSHQATEDIAMFRGMPNLTIIEPCDAHEIEQIVPAIAAHKGPVYMRLLRGNVPLVLDEYDYQFELGKAKLLRNGRDAL